MGTYKLLSIPVKADQLDALVAILKKEKHSGQILAVLPASFPSPSALRLDKGTISVPNNLVKTFERLRKTAHDVNAHIFFAGMLEESVNQKFHIGGNNGFMISPSVEAPIKHIRKQIADYPTMGKATLNFFDAGDLKVFPLICSEVAEHSLVPMSKDKADLAIISASGPIFASGWHSSLATSLEKVHGKLLKEKSIRPSSPVIVSDDYLAKDLAAGRQLAIYDPASPKAPKIKEHKGVHYAVHELRL